MERIYICTNPYCEANYNDHMYAVNNWDFTRCYACESILKVKCHIQASGMSDLTKAIEKARGGPAPITRVGYA